MRRADERITNFYDQSNSVHFLLQNFEDILFVTQFPSPILAKQSISWLTGLNCFIVIVSWKTSTGRDNQLQFVHFSEGKQFTQLKSAISRTAFLVVLYMDFTFLNIHFPSEFAIFVSNTPWDQSIIWTWWCHKIYHEIKHTEILIEKCFLYLVPGTF